MDTFYQQLNSTYPFLYCYRRKIYWWGNSSMLLTWRYEMKVWLNKLAFLLCQINQIRDSLAVMGDNSTAFSLPQVRCMRQPLVFLFCGRTILAALMAVNCWVLKYLTSVHIISCALNLCTAHWKMQNMIFLEDPIVYLFSFKLHIWHVSNVNSVWRCTLFSPLCTPMGSWYPEILPFFSLICKGHSYVIWMIRNLIHCIWKGEINWNKLFHPW